MLVLPNILSQQQVLAKMRNGVRKQSKGREFFCFVFSFSFFVNEDTIKKKLQKEKGRSTYQSCQYPAFSTLVFLTIKSAF